MKIFKIYKRSLAFTLLENGHKLLYTENNYRKPKFTVFCFEDNEEFRKDFIRVK